MHHRKLTSFALWVAFAAPVQAQDGAQIEVRAVHADATPAPGVELAIYREPTETFGLGDFAVTVKTDEHGRAFVPLSGAQRADLKGGRVNHLVAKVLGSRQTRVELDAQALHGTPIALVVPAFGFVRAKVLAPDGSPVDGGYARIEWHASADEPKHPRGATACLEPVRKGELLSWPLEIGGQIDLRFDLRQELEISRLRLPGPTRPGEVVEIDLSAKTAAVLTATLVDETGRPLAGEMVEVRWWYGRVGDPDADHPFDKKEVLTCDAAGRARWCVEPDFAASYRLGRLRVRLEPGRNPRHVRWTLASGLAARCDLPPVPVEGENDLGTLRLALMPLLVAGRTIDAHRAPVPDVTLRVHYLRPHGFWGQEQHLYAQSDAAGLFEIRAFADEVGSTFRERTSRFRLGAERKGFSSGEPLPFSPGAQDLDVVLGATGSVELQIASGDADLWRFLHMDLELLDREGRIHGPEREGTSIYRWHTVPAGGYRLEVRDQATGLLIYRCEPLLVRDAAPLRDPRCWPVEVDGLAKRVHLFVRNERGNFVERGHVRFPNLPGSGTATITGGEAVLALPSGTSVDALVLVDGFRPCAVEGWATDLGIALRPSLRRVLQVIGAPAHEVDKAAAFAFELQHAADSPLASLLRVPLALPRTPAAAPFEVELPGPGRYVLKTRGRSYRGPIDVVPPGVTPLPQVQTEPPHRPQEWTFEVTEGEQPPIVLAWRN